MALLAVFISDNAVREALERHAASGEIFACSVTVSCIRRTVLRPLTIISRQLECRSCDEVPILLVLSRAFEIIERR